MATVNGFKMDHIVDLILSGAAPMTLDELFSRIKSAPAPENCTVQRTTKDLYDAVTDNDDWQ